MTPERWQQVEQLLDAALELPPGERAAYLDAACGADAELRAEVERILVASDDPTPLPASPLELAAVVGATPVPQRFGPWRVLRPLGRGGMGAVFLAERADDEFSKLVAIKVLPPSFGSPELMSRFRHERQILARLEHAGIARLLDGGIVDGTPYIVMEYVEGEPIDVFCNTRGLPLRQRLRLVAAVCEAVEYAHRNLIVHRDLKPANILVTADGAVKLLDFGIAKLLDAEDVDAPATRTGVYAMTPEYAAPEQVRGGVVTTATDVYALGVLMYQLLVGSRPYELAGRSFTEIERAICDTEPTRPSAAVRRAAESAGTTGQARTSGPGRPVPSAALERSLRGDLDTIVLRAMHKDPQRRYASASALLEDLQRYDAGHPVHARPDTLAYRTGKFVRRHTVAVAAGLALLVSLNAFAFRESQLRHRAESAVARERAVRGYLIDVFRVADPFGARPERAEEVTARMLLDRGLDRLDVDLGDEPDVQAEMLGLFGEVYANLGEHERAASLMERWLAQRRASHGSRSAAAAEALHGLAGVYRQQAQLEKAEEAAREALALRRQTLGQRHLLTAESLDQLATVLQERSMFDAAEPLFREALEIRQRRLGPDHEDVATSANNLALLLSMRASYEESERLYRASLATRERVLGADHPLSATTAQNLAQVLHLQGKLAEAEPLFRSSLESKRRFLNDAHPSVTVHISNLGVLLRDMGRLEESEAHLREALELDRTIFGDEHSYIAAGMLQLAATLRDRGLYDESARMFRDALALCRRLFGEEHSRVIQAHDGLGSTLYRMSDDVGAERSFRAAHDVAARVLGDAHPRTVSSEVNLTRALLALGSTAEAEDRLRSIVDRFEPRDPTLRYQLASAHVVLGQVLAATDRPADAAATLDLGVELMRDAYGESDWRTAEARLSLGVALLSLGRRQEAEGLIADADDALRRTPVQLPRLRSASEAALARVRRPPVRAGEAASAAAAGRTRDSVAPQTARRT